MTRQPQGWRADFSAMASPCEVHVAEKDPKLARRVANAVVAEARRIEAKFSRYRPDSIVSSINTSEGQWIELDEETAKLIVYAGRLYELSERRFDITSGILRRVWRFDGSDRIPQQAAIDELLDKIGWERVDFDGERIRLEPGMEIDFGGIGKEYAVDRAGLLAQKIVPNCLINFGGDLVATSPAPSSHRWHVAIDTPEKDGRPPAHIELVRGGIATSGDAERYLLKEGRRYSHILNPLTGWPVENAPRSITVSAATCTQAGMTATLAMLRGSEAEQFLDAEGVEYWCLR